MIYGCIELPGVAVYGQYEKLEAITGRTVEDVSHLFKFCQAFNPILLESTLELSSGVVGLELPDRFATPFSLRFFKLSGTLLGHSRD